MECMYCNRTPTYAVIWRTDGGLRWWCVRGHRQWRYHIRVCGFLGGGWEDCKHGEMLAVWMGRTPGYTIYRCWKYKYYISIHVGLFPNSAYPQSIQCALFEVYGQTMCLSMIDSQRFCLQNVVMQNDHDQSHEELLGKWSRVFEIGSILRHARRSISSGFKHIYCFLNCASCVTRIFKIYLFI